MFFWEIFPSIDAAKPRLPNARYIAIDCAAGKVRRIILRPLPTLANWWYVKFVSGIARWCRGRADQCWVYCDQPGALTQFLAIRYVESTLGTQYATIRSAAQAIDEIAAVKKIDAALCDACNARISERLLRRWGWVTHAPSRWNRNFIKRYYQPENKWTII